MSAFLRYKYENSSNVFNVLLILILTFMLPDFSYAQGTTMVSADKAVDGAGYKIFIKNSQISLSAEDASIKSIMEDIGHEMNIAIDARIPKDEKISINVKNQPLEEILKLFDVNYALVTDSGQKGGSIKRIIIVPEGEQAQIAMTASDNSDRQNKKRPDPEVKSKNEPFKFEFDPSKVIDKE